RAGSSLPCCLACLGLHAHGLRLTLLPLELEHGAAAAGRGLEPDAAALPRDDPAHDRQSHAAALHLVARLERLEHLEHALRVFLRYAFAVVGDGEDVVIVMLLAGDHDPAFGSRVMRYRIADEIAEHLLERRGVGGE